MTDDQRPKPHTTESARRRWSRREFLASGVAAAVTVAVGCDRRQPLTQPSSLPPSPTLANAPFALGVASGDPTASAVILWARLTQDPLNGGGMPAERIAVGWQIADDDAFTRFRGSGWTWATPEFGHSVHVDVTGLPENHWFYYRFFTKDWQSPVGRTRTIPGPTASTARLKLAIASCQNYTAGYFTAHRYLAQEPELDLVLFLGDYIYESSSYKIRVHSHDNTAPQTLVEYRDRYAQYRLDPDLQLAHLRHPWLTIWDDHEVVNNYGGYFGELPSVRQRIVDAYQAFYEHTPMRATPQADGTLWVHQISHFGDLVQFDMIDTRQFRTRPCKKVEANWDCDGVSMLGMDQERWLLDALAASQSRWNALVTGVVFSETTGGGLLTNDDQWDGYLPTRQKILDQVVVSNIEGFMTLSGDIHTAALGFLTANPSDATSQRLGAEIVSNSISAGGSSGFIQGELATLVKSLQPNIEYINGLRRGYTLCEIDREHWRVFYRIVDTVDTPDGQLSTDAAYEIDRAGQITPIATDA